MARRAITSGLWQPGEREAERRRLDRQSASFPRALDGSSNILTVRSTIARLRGPANIPCRQSMYHTGLEFRLKHCGRSTIS